MLAGQCNPTPANTRRKHSHTRAHTSTHIYSNIDLAELAGNRRNQQDSCHVVQERREHSGHSAQQQQQLSFVALRQLARQHTGPLEHACAHRDTCQYYAHFPYSLVRQVKMKYSNLRAVWKCITTTFLPECLYSILTFQFTVCQVCIATAPFSSFVPVDLVDRNCTMHPI